MDLLAAAVKLEKGLSVKSEVSQTVYSYDKEGLKAEGKLVTPDYMTEKEKNGKFTLVQLVTRIEDITELPLNTRKEVLHEYFEWRNSKGNAGELLLAH